MAGAARVGAVIERDRIPVREDASLLCGMYDLDPLGTIASGALLMAVPPEHVAPVQQALQTNGIDCAVIGRLVSAAEGVFMEDGGLRRPLPWFASDEITRLFTE
jgi:hydrogenase expression/formation protein HypE